jgi:hypothetical protein
MGLIGSLTGEDGKKALALSKAKSDKLLDKGYGEATPDYDASVTALQNPVESGDKNRKMIDDLTGVNGPEARAAAQQLVASDPMWQGLVAQSSNALLRGLNATGAATGGKAQRASMENMTTQWGDWINRYQRGAENGQQATNALAAGLQARGGFKYGHYGTKAGNEINYGNAQAAQSNVFGQNFISGAGIVAGAMKPVPTPA